MNVKRMILTSQGLINQAIVNVFLSCLPKRPSDCRILVVFIKQSDLNESVEWLKNLGLKDIILFNLNRRTPTDVANNCDIIYVCGGNTFYILKRFRKTGLDEIVIRLVNQGVLYFGISAGGIITGPNIEIAGLETAGDRNNVKLKNLSGLNLIDFAVLTHFVEERDGKEAEEVRNRVSYSILSLTDNQAVLVRDHTYEVVGC